MADEPIKGEANITEEPDTVRATATTVSRDELRRAIAHLIHLILDMSAATVGGLAGESEREARRRVVQERLARIVKEFNLEDLGDV